MNRLLFALCLITFLMPSALFAVGRQSQADIDREQKNKERAEARNKQQYEKRLKDDPEFFFVGLSGSRLESRI